MRSGDRGRIAERGIVRVLALDLPLDPLPLLLGPVQLRLDAGRLLAAAGEVVQELALEQGDPVRDLLLPLLQLGGDAAPDVDPPLGQQVEQAARPGPLAGCQRRRQMAACRVALVQAHLEVDVEVVDTRAGRRRRRPAAAGWRPWDGWTR